MAAARTYQHPDTADIALARVLFALSEPLRLSMVGILAKRGEVDSLELGPDLPRSTLTHHTSLLRESGVVFVRAEGRKCLIRLRTADLESRFPGLVGTVLAGYADEAGQDEAAGGAGQDEAAADDAGQVGAAGGAA
ncbi:helix-turn-helix transcriptional regulator [Streptomyces sp. NPDC051214]|uniref:ArsR/SmtB family transcription factor n=1 Tax=Streptomyces sp. NPDC051214 TaxID=3155282 RepID=UPI0034163B16